MSSQIQGLFMTMRLWDVLDILVVAFFLYRIYILIRDTRATALLKGLVFLGLFTVLAGWLQLHVVSWILDKLMTVLIVASGRFSAGAAPGAGADRSREILCFLPHDE